MTVCNKYPREMIHYDKQLKKRYFRKLRYNVWFSKTRWQLLMKAEFIHRFRLLVYYFHAWLYFARHQIRNRRILEVADCHYFKKLKSTVFLLLKLNVEHRWILITAFRKKLRTKTLRRVWLNWEKYVQKIAKWKEITSLTLKMRQMHLIKLYIELWFIRYADKSFYEEMLIKAETHYNLMMKRRTLYLWKSYLGRNNAKKEFLFHLSINQNLKIKQRALEKLMQNATQRRLYKNHVQRITSFYENYLIKTALDKWTAKYDVLVESRSIDKYNLAVSTCNKKLLSLGFRQLKIWAHNGKRRATAANSFIAVADQIKIKFYLAIWRKRLLLKLFSKSLEAKAVNWRNHHLQKIFLFKLAELFEVRKAEKKRIELFISLWNYNILERILRKWICFTNARRRKKNEYQAAKHYYENNISLKSLQKLKNHVVHKGRQRSASNYYNLRLKLKFFKFLMANNEIQRSRRIKISALRKRQEQKIVLRVFAVLKEASASTTNKRAFVSELADFKRKKRIFRQWKKYSEITRKGKLLENENQLILQNIKTYNAILSWWKNTHARLKFREELRKIKINQEKRLVGKYFSKYLNLIEKFKLINESTLIFIEKRIGIVLHYCILRMKVALEERRTLRSRQELVYKTEREIKLKRTFSKWVSYVKWKKDKIRELSAKASYSKSKQNERSKSYCCAVKPKRKPPLIPVYLSGELFSYIQTESRTSQQFSNADDYEIVNYAEEKYK